MKTYAQVRAGRVLAHFATDRPPSDFADIAHELHEAPADVQDGWSYANGVFAPYQPTAEELRQAAQEDAIAADTTLAQIKAMTPAQFDTWWAANITNLATLNAFVKRLARLVIRRVL
jgi:hypothetical protein